jgi:VIT1/CCC1 family predicted Fe2+/Mn2+ transporter
MEGPALAQLEGRHRSAGGNALRAAVLGANDGLVSNFSLIMGVAGAEVANSTIVLTGIAGLLAGAISMALGEWVSVQSSRELYKKQISTEQEEIAANPEREIEELALIYQARGLEEPAAQRLARQIMSNEEGALEALSATNSVSIRQRWAARREAAITSFLLFAIGAIIPCFRSSFSEAPRLSSCAHLRRDRPVCHRRSDHTLHRPINSLLHAADVVRRQRAAVTF